MLLQGVGEAGSELGPVREGGHPPTGLGAGLQLAFAEVLSSLSCALQK